MLVIWVVSDIGNGDGFNGGVSVGIIIDEVSSNNESGSGYYIKYMWVLYIFLLSYLKLKVISFVCIYLVVERKVFKLFGKIGKC